jgi:hypothetical protein
MAGSKYENFMKCMFKMNQIARRDGWARRKCALLSNIEIHHGMSSLHRTRKHEKANPLTFVPLGDLLLAWYAGLHHTIMQALVVSTRMVTYSKRQPLVSKHQG